MRRFVVALSCLAFSLLAPGSHADPVEDYMKSEMAQRRIPGAALKVIQGGQAVKTAAYGVANLEHNVPVKPETVFEIGSITKQITAAAILLLAQDGKLSLDDKISRHLKDTPDTWRDVTVRHLLTHTSGIKTYTGLDGFELTRNQTQEQLIEKLARLPVEFQPGESFKYCNSGYSLLGYIIANVSGKTYWDFLSERVFKPLGMNATTNRMPGLVIPNRASGYEQTNRVHINRDYDLTDIFAAGAIVSTVEDLAKWDAALNGESLLNAGSKEQMWTLSELNSGKPTKYGFGWYVDTYEGRRNIGHGGSTSGFSASIQRFPDEKLTVILLTNGDGQAATPMAKKIASLYFTQKTAQETR
jgi:D-alanyl-D-alanine carboxypeptidase